MAQGGRRTAGGPRARTQVNRSQTAVGDAQRVLTNQEIAALRARLRAVIEPVVESIDLYLEDLAVSRAGRRFVVRVTVDADTPIGHDELTEASREISATLDAAEESGGTFPADSYTLEVSSPGVDRPLTQPRHWRRSIGRLVRVTAGGHGVTARVLGVDRDAVEFEGVGPIAFSALGPGRVQIEFTRLEQLRDDELGDEFADDGDDDGEGVRP
jgi:ribosome maturation factor RimP